MQFRLTYEGPLRSLSEEDRQGKKSLCRGTEKQKIRKQFHPQLKELWGTNRLLRDTKIPKGGTQTPVPIGENHGGFFNTASSANTGRSLLDDVAAQYQCFGYSFVPLVRNAWSLACSLDILFLRRDPPGGVYNAGDLDNRMKTLIDGLRMPRVLKELGDFTTPEHGETPFFTLLEDDKCITALSVESDTLLDAPDPKKDETWARVIITATIRPYVVTTFNAGMV